MKRLVRLTVAAAGAALALMALAGPAAAHTEAEATAASAGRTAITFTYEQECADEAPATGLRVQVPDGATDVQPQPVEGWTASATATEVDWRADGPPTADQDTFTVEMVLAEPAGATVYLPAIQLCPDGEEIAWIQLPGADGAEPEFPAPSIVVPENATVATTPTTAPETTTTAGPTTTVRMAAEATPVTTEGSETNNGGLVVGLIAVGVIAVGALVLYLRHRQPRPKA